MTVKVVFYGFGETKVPVMLINLSGRSIVSIPTQIGCAIGCTFCLSSASKFERSLTAGELVALVEFGLCQINHETALVSFTGEGEPFLNLSHINAAMAMLHTNAKISHFRLCTSGIKPGLFERVERFSKPLNFQLSLHSLNDAIRFQLIPKTKPVESILAALKRATPHFDEVAVNYLLMDGVNDSDDDMEALIESVDPRWVVKLNPLIGDGPYKASSRREEWGRKLALSGVNAAVFNSVGSKIGNGLYGHLTHAQNNRIA